MTSTHPRRAVRPTYYEIHHDNYSATSISTEWLKCGSEHDQPSAGMDAFRGPLIPTALLRTEGQTTPSRKRAIEMSGAASYYI
jgi:hypothetical protein